MARRKAQEIKTTNPEAGSVNVNIDAAKAAEKEAKAAAKAAEKAENSVKTNAASTTVTGLGSRLRLVNTSRNIFIFPLSQFVRESILPSRHWDVPDEHIEQVKKCLKGSYYQALIGKKLLKVVDVAPSRLGEADLTAPETPEAPKELTETSEHVTQAGFVKED